MCAKIGLAIGAWKDVGSLMNFQYRDGLLVERYPIIYSMGYSINYITMIVLIIIFIVIILCTYYYTYNMNTSESFSAGCNGDILIRLVDRSMGGYVPPTVKFSKVISIRSGKDRGTVKILGFESEKVNEYSVTRNDVMNLLYSINYIWGIPSAGSTEDPVYEGMLLEVYIGSKKWVNGKPSTCVHRGPSIEVTAYQQNLYDRAVDTVLNWM
jgi:hypothetical protein